MSNIPETIKEVFDFIYESSASDSTCTGQDAGYEGREIILFPFEHLYLKTRLGEENHLNKDVPKHTSCPYKIDGACSIPKDKPIQCRMGALEVTKASERSIEVSLKNLSLDENFVNNAVQFWSGAIIALWSSLPGGWWDRKKKSMDGFPFRTIGVLGFELEGDEKVLTLEEPTRPTLIGKSRGKQMTYEEMRKYIDPDCQLCGGKSGLLNDEYNNRVPCTCVRRNYWG